MDTINVKVGCYARGSSGVVQDTTRPVVFEGKKLGSMTHYATGCNGAPTDTRGVTETLYRTADDRLVVYVDDWSRWQGEPDTYSLHEVAQTDLQPGGLFESLGRECGFGRPLTLDEALSAS